MKNVSDNDMGVKIESQADRTTVTAGEWAMVVWPEAPGSEPRIRDIDAAKRLGFARPRDIRKIIERIWPENAGLYVRATVARTRMPTGGTRETAIEEVWLTEAQLLKVIARSETPIAEAILDEMTVYMAVRRGLVQKLVAQQVSGMLDELRAEIAELRGRVLEGGSAVIPFGSRQRVATIRRMTATLASMWARLDPATSLRAESSRVQSKMRAAIGFAPQRGHSLDVLTTDQFERAVQYLHAEIADAERQLPRTAQSHLSIVRTG